jgi:hypothetical protein
MDRQGALERDGEEIVKDTQKNITVIVNPSVDDNLYVDIASGVKNGTIPPEFLDRALLALTGSHLGNPRGAKDMLKILNRIAEANKDLQIVMASQGQPLKGERLRFSVVGEVTLRKELIQTEIDQKEHHAKLYFPTPV